MKDSRRLERTADGCGVTLKSEDGVTYELRFEDPAMDYIPLALEGSLAEIAGELRRIADWVLPPVAVDPEQPWIDPALVRYTVTNFCTRCGQSIFDGRCKCPIPQREARRVAASRSVWDESRQVDTYPSAGTHCSLCGMLQYDTPGGACCINGHGGAPSKEG